MNEEDFDDIQSFNNRTKSRKSRGRKSRGRKSRGRKRSARKSRKSRGRKRSARKSRKSRGRKRSARKSRKSRKSRKYRAADPPVCEDLDPVVKFNDITEHLLEDETSSDHKLVYCIKPLVNGKCPKTSMLSSKPSRCRSSGEVAM